MVALPRVEADKISFYEISSCDHLSKSRWGILEPLPDRKITDIDLLIVPGIAFDKMGRRLGYGRGYFDRYIGINKPRFTIGLAYSFQLVESLPHYNHDQILDAIAIESKIIYT